MSATIFFCVLVLLAIGVWAVAVCSFWYGKELLKRQSALTNALLPYLKKIEQDKATMKALNIDKNEPISKYQEVVIPDEVHIAFTEEKK